MDINGVFLHVQGMFRAGTVLIVGSGSSNAFGLPGMPQLADHLVKNLVSAFAAGSKPDLQWAQIKQRLSSGAGLETALKGIDLAPELASGIGIQISECIEDSERAAIAEIVQSPTTHPYGRLLTELMKGVGVLDVVTTNYDRLIEVASAAAGIRVDTMFHGSTLGLLDATQSKLEHLRRETPTRGKERISFAPHVRLAKPHGSLDWHEIGGRVFRSDLRLDGSRKIIAPGDGKYLAGYEVPFDAQRERANAAIDKASGFFALGYGFNDDHLQTHLKTAFSAVPSVVIARTLSPTARQFLSASTKAVGIERAPDGSGSVILTPGGTLAVNEQIWQLDELLKKVMSI